METQAHFRERMRRGIAEYTTPRQISRVQDEHKSHQVKRIGAADGKSGGTCHQVGMNTCHERNPGDQRGIFYRIPGPVARKRQCLIGPGAAHQNPCSKYRTGEKRPLQCRTQPVFVLPQPESRYRKCKGNQGAGKTQKQGWRVNRHPIVLQQGIQTIAFYFIQVIRLVENRRIHGIAQQIEGAGAEPEIAKPEPQNHACYK